MSTDFSKLTVAELRLELKKHGLPQAGKKAELVDRLSAAVENERSEVASDAAEAKQPAESPSPPEPAVPVPDTVGEALEEPYSTHDAPITDARDPLSSASTAVVDLHAPPVPEPSNAPDEAHLPNEEVTTTIINGGEDSGSSESAPAIIEVIRDIQNRKRRSRTPSIDENVRKRLRRDSFDHEKADLEIPSMPVGDGPTGDQSDEGQVSERAVAEETTEEMPVSNAAKEEVMELDQEDGDRSPSTAKNTSNQHNSIRDVAMYDVQDNGVALSEAEQHFSDRDQSYSNAKVMDDKLVDGSFGADERPVVPAMHPATSALYIKNFMRPLRWPVVEEHLISLATPPGREPKPGVVVDFYLDSIRTHAFVNFDSISAASRVRSALHDQIWPDETNRKALWVDFVPPEKMREWIDKEQADGRGGRGNFHRWEVLYETNAEGSMTASLVEADAETSRRNSRVVPPSAMPAGPVIPTGPSRGNTGIEGAPLGPRGGGGRMAPPQRPHGSGTLGGGSKSTQSLPSLLYKPVSDEVAMRRIDNMRSYYTTDKYRDMGRDDEINRYTFENADTFVDRGVEVFIGIRPPHREREVAEMRRRGGGGGRVDAQRGPPPPSFRQRGDRYMGGRNGGRDDFVPRSRLNGAPLPTYGGRFDGRGGRNGYGGYRR